MLQADQRVQATATMSEPKVLATLSEPFLAAQNVLGEGSMVFEGKGSS
jgi:hypothetical protein